MTATTNSRMPTGCYVGNPNGTDASGEAYFLDRFQRHVAIMGTPATMNAFTDFSQDPSTWGDNASWTAWSWNQSKAGLAAVRPIVGVKLADSNHFFPNSDGFYQDILAGKHDAHYAAVAAAWAKAGFKRPVFRLAYEMDGKFMPDYQGETQSVQQDFVAAFRRISPILKHAALTNGADSCAVEWNPASMNWTALSVADSYPGDDVVDIVGLDVYSPVYNGSLYIYGTANDFAPDQVSWFSQLSNRQHYWTWPSANQWNQQGNGSGWGIRDTVAFALKHKKSLAISECGQGADGSTTGLVDDPEFAKWLKSELDLAGKQGLAISHVNIWNANLDDGKWSYLPEDNKPLAAAAWKANFGAY